jgi:hypothetical protein
VGNSYDGHSGGGAAAEPMVHSALTIEHMGGIHFKPKAAQHARASLRTARAPTPTAAARREGVHARCPSELVG